LSRVPDAVKRTALAIETFHKASLVHDDIEDDDAYRYGDTTLHRRYGTPTAINVGDYLIGLGYRLVSRETVALGAEITADILDRLADAHLKLAEGQGAELLWRDSLQKRLSPLDALKIYALKTAPAFEAALYCGARLAGPADALREPLGQFARHLGVAFQILNDLTDWDDDEHNKLAAGGDILGGRPTVLWALAWEGLDEPQRQELERLMADPRSDGAKLVRVRQLYRAAGVFDNAAKLVDKYRQRAEAVADQIEPDELRRLLYYLIDTVLEDQPVGQLEPVVLATLSPATPQ
jgi:geranylgeranyl pyrophosphate synthase